jgi:hypothetical protein
MRNEEITFSRICCSKNDLPEPQVTDNPARSPASAPLLDAFRSTSTIPARNFHSEETPRGRPVERVYIHFFLWGYVCTIPGELLPKLASFLAWWRGMCAAILCLIPASHQHWRLCGRFKTRINLEERITVLVHYLCCCGGNSHRFVETQNDFLTAQATARKS